MKYFIFIKSNSGSPNFNISYMAIYYISGVLPERRKIYIVSIHICYLRGTAGTDMVFLQPCGFC